MSEKTTLEPFDGTLGSLAKIIANGFDDTQKQFGIVVDQLENLDGRFGHVEKELVSVREENSSFRAETEASFSRIELRLTEVPYRFELVDLERPVSRIEGKIGSTPSAT